MKHGLKLLGLALLAALSLMAISAGAAQAESTSVLIENKTFAEQGITEESIKGTLGEGELLTKTGKIKIKCTGGSVKGSIKGDGTGKGELLASGCTVKEAPHCIVLESLTNSDHAILATGNVKVVLDNGKYFLLAEGLGALKEFAKFIIEDDGTETCLLAEGGEPTHYVIEGSTVAAITGTPEKEEKVHTIETIDPATLATLFPNDKLFLGAEESHLSGGIKGSAELSGKFKEKNWSLMMS